MAGSLSSIRQLDAIYLRGIFMSKRVLVFAVIMALIILWAPGVVGDAAGAPVAPAPEAKAYPSLPKYLLNSTHLVRVTIESKEHGIGQGYGSAFALDLSEFGIAEHKYLMTAAHVVQSFETPGHEMALLVEIKIEEGGKERWIIARVIECDMKADLCLLRVEEEIDGVVPLAAKEDEEVGDALVAVGCPAGAAVSATFGFLISKHQVVHEKINEDDWESSTAIFSGNSGGPMFDPNSHSVVGVVIQGITVPGVGMASNIALFVRLDVIRAFLSAPVKRIKSKS